MNNFNELFLVIKRVCGKQRGDTDINCFDDLVKQINIPVDKLEIYLNHLQKIGVIRYSIPEKYIYLTPFGKKQETLIKNPD